MKITVIFITILTLLFASCATGQKAAVESSGAQPEAVRAPGGQVPVETKSSVLFADGSLDEYLTSDYDSSLTNLVNQNRYSASGTLLEQMEYAYQEDRGWLTTKITRDVENRLKTRIVYEYDGQGRMIRETLVNKSGKAVSSYTYGYDEKGNRVSRAVNSGTGAKLAETKYTFNNAGLIIASETKDGSGNTINSTENQYDTGGNLISQKVYNSRGDVTTEINAVWQNGDEVENEQIDSSGEVQLRITNEYGPEHELIRRKVENIQGQSTQILEYEYTFKPVRQSN
jgi:YD repeat-containing protein